MAPALFSLATPLHTVEYPLLYLKASGELLALMAAVSWTVTYIFNPDFLLQNPLRDRFGYNNVCVGWDSAPARYVATPIGTAMVYLVLRFCWTDYQRMTLAAKQGLISETQRRLALTANALYSLVFTCFPLLLLLDPDDSAFGKSFWHTTVFFFIILSRWLVVAVHMLIFSRYHGRISTGGILFLTFYTVITVLLAAMMEGTAYWWDDQYQESGLTTKPEPPVPLWMCNMVDVSWFICMPLTNIFLPSGPKIRQVFELMPSAVHHGDVKFPDGSVLSPVEMHDLCFRLVSSKQIRAAKPRPDSSTIPCPVTAALYNHGFITPDSGGLVPWKDYAAGLATVVGMGQMEVAKLFAKLQKALPEPDRKHGLPLFKLRSSNFKTPWTTGVRCPNANGRKKRMAELLKHLCPNGEARIWAAQLNVAQKHLNDGSDFATMLEAFGHVDPDRPYERYLTPDDLSSLLVDGVLPAGFHPHRWTAADLFAETLAVSLGCPRFAKAIARKETDSHTAHRRASALGDMVLSGMVDTVAQMEDLDSAPLLSNSVE